MHKFERVVQLPSMNMKVPLLRVLAFVTFGNAALACTSTMTSPHSTGDGGQGGVGGENGGGQGGASVTPCDGTPEQWCGYKKYCDAPANSCPSGNVSGTCAQRPNDNACTGETMQPACACDGRIFINACEAHVAGVDVGSSEDCTPPANSFLCGPVLCEDGTTYCERVNADRHCRTLPEICKTADSMCDCLADMLCFSAPGPPQCEKDADGHFVVTCQITE